MKSPESQHFHHLPDEGVGTGVNSVLGVGNRLSVGTKKYRRKEKIMIINKLKVSLKVVCMSERNNNQLGITTIL